MTNEYYIIWQDPVDGLTYPVAKLQRVQGLFIFVYTKGAERSERFVPFGNMSRMDAVYISHSLFPIIANRVLSEKRPEYHKYAYWSDLKSGEDPLVLMARMGGERATDGIRIYSVPEQSEDGKYRTVFFCHGLSRLPLSAQQRTLQLERGDQLFPMADQQNKFDVDAIALRTSDPVTMIGYCPRHLAVDVRDLLTLARATVSISVIKVNPDAPLQFRVLCEAVAEWPVGFRPCSRNEYQPLVHFDPVGLASDALVRLVPTSKH